MAEELSQESKIYVKEEIDKIRKEFKEDLKEVQTKATKTFTTVALIIGLLASVGVLSLAKGSIKDAIRDELGKSTIKNLENDANNLLVEIGNIKGKAEETAKGAESLVGKLEERRSKVEQNLIVAEGRMEEILDLKKIAHLPIGTIISSMLDPSQFLKAVGDPDRATKDWVLADGRPIAATSGYSQLSGRTNTPDLRGMFLRGVNKGRVVGSFQDDALQQHGHETNARTHGWGAMGDTQGWTKRAGEAPLASVTIVKQPARTADETRPKNVAVYFYIKIN